MSLSSPLRYPGGKSRAAEQILRYVPDGTRSLLSPFIGGGHVEVSAEKSGITVVASDLYYPLVAFWREMLSSPDSLADAIEKFHPCTPQKASKLLSRSNMKRTSIAAEFFVVNRCSFSGLSSSGGFSQESCDKRFTASSIARVRNFRAKNLTVNCADFRLVMDRHPRMFTYADPPYYRDDLALYGKRGNTHKGFPHRELAETLRSRESDWILSYDDHEEVRKMYHGFRMHKLKWAYGLNLSKKSNEILILSHSISEPKDQNRLQF
jgi:DNA adenine methylase